MITTREFQIAELTAWGQSEKDIARKLYLSADTVKTHKKNLMRKIQAHNIADVTRWFFSKTTNIKFVKSQFAKQVISIIFLSLTFFDITEHRDIYRVYRCRRVETRVSRVRRNEKTYAL
jgi:DNA-binding CsgD family transcriptional regulator